MPDSKARATLTVFLAIAMVVGFTAAPVAAIDAGISADGDGATVEADDSEVSASDEGLEVDEDDEPIDEDDADVESTLGDLDDEHDEDDEDDGAPANLSDAPVPEWVCGEYAEAIHGEVPWDEVPWTSDLPEEVQPPGVPLNILTPRAITSIAVAAAPNQCDVQDPNDPSYDPLEEGVEPDADVEDRRLGPYRDGAVTLIFYDATLNESGDGPGASGKVGTLVTSAAGDFDAEVAINDGEKDYVVDPQVRYWEDGTAYAGTEIWAMNGRFATEVDCDGEECQPEYHGLMREDVPAIPAPTGQDGDDGDDGEDDEFEPSEDNVEPAADVDVRRLGEYRDGGVALVFYEVTLNESGDGPAAAGKVGTLATSSAGDLDVEVTINDGEQDYKIDPRVRYWDDGSIYLENDVVVIENRTGVELDCTGDECETDHRAGQEVSTDGPDDDESSDDGSGDDGSSDGESHDGSGDSDGTEGTDDGNETDDTGTSAGTGGSSGSDDGSTDGQTDGSTGDQSDGSNADRTDDSTEDEADDGTEDGSEEETDESADDDRGSEPALEEPGSDEAAQVDGPGFGVVVGLLALLVASRRAARSDAF